MESIETFDIAFVSSEMAPFAKMGGLGDVSASLPRELARKGHDVRVFLPWYGRIDDELLEVSPVAAAQQVPLPLSGRYFTFNLFEHTPKDDLGAERVYLIQCAPLFERDDLVYTDHDDEHIRWGFFANAVLESLQRLQWGPQILHCNDWPTGLLPMLLRRKYAWDGLFADTRSVMTIHNLAYQGRFPTSAFTDLDLGMIASELDPATAVGQELNFLRIGLVEADHITTVSPNYAREIQTVEQGCGVDDLLRSRSHELTGILNGIDEETWHPERDVYVPHRFSAHTLWRRSANKRDLQARMGLELDDTKPLLGLIARLTSQKGIGLLADVLPRILEQDHAQLVVLGSGEERYEALFTELHAKFPGAAAFSRGYDEALSHHIEAGSDLFLMPSHFEPCGLNQMYSQSYGAIPVVHRTGGLADTVERVDDDCRAGTGFVFEPFTAAALDAELRRGLEFYADRDCWQELMRRAMAKSWSWGDRAEQYVDLYRQLSPSAEPA